MEQITSDITCQDPESESGSHASADRESQTRESFVLGSAETLRTRFATLKGYGQLVRRQLHSTPIHLEHTWDLADELDQQLHAFETLLLAFLQASCLQWRTPDLAPNRVDLVELSRKVLTQFVSAPERTPRHTLRAETSEAVVGTWDAHWISEAVSALVSNALKYSPDGGEIRLTVRRDGDDALLAVRDAGIGVAPDECELIFQPFTRGHAARELGPGVGLGLFIASRVATFHGGYIDIDSTPAAGSVFTMHLPLEPPALLYA
jgi:signal transduction histidine kinase